jgi:hypothetical protein
VLVPAVAGVDDARRRPAGDLLRRAARAVANDECVDAHRAIVSMVSRRLSPLLTTAGRDGEVHRVGAERFAAGVEARPVRVESSKNS